MKKILTLILILIMTSVTAFAVMDTTANFKFHRKYVNTQGDVYFNHKAHVVFTGRDCFTCHNATYIEHPDVGGFINGATKGHLVCRGCHVDYNAANGTSAPENDCSSAACHGNTAP